MRTCKAKVMRCVISKAVSEEEKKLRINSTKEMAQRELQHMIYNEINNSLYSKDDCFVFCYFGETGLYKRPYDDDILVKDFIYSFVIVNEKTREQAKAVADSYYYVIKKNCLSQGTAITKQNMGLYKVPYKFLKSLQEISPLNFKAL